MHFSKAFTVGHQCAAVAGVLGCSFCVLHADGTDSSAAPVLTMPSHETLPGAAAVTENGSASVRTEAEAQNATADPEHAQPETAAFSSPEKDQLSSPGLSVVTKVQELLLKNLARMHHHTFMRVLFDATTCCPLISLIIVHVLKSQGPAHVVQSKDMTAVLAKDAFLVFRALCKLSTRSSESSAGTDPTAIRGKVHCRTSYWNNLPQMILTKDTSPERCSTLSQCFKPYVVQISLSKMAIMQSERNRHIEGGRV